MLLEGKGKKKKKEKSIVAFKALKEVVRCQDPQHARPENIPTTRDKLLLALAMQSSCNTNSGREG